MTDNANKPEPVEFETTIHFKHLSESKKRITIEQGSARSAKTYNIVFHEISVLAHSLEPLVWTIARKTLTAAKASVVRDFKEIMERLGLWDDKCWNKTTCEYQFRNHLIEFIGVDSQKARGRRRNRLFCNEANELTHDEFRQLAIRTTDKIILDYNPSDEFHWIYDELIPRDDADFYVTTYKENPFLDKGIIQEIEALQKDPEYWSVFGLGQRATKRGTIYTRWEVATYDPHHKKNEVGGIDFGFNDPNVIVTQYLDDGVLHVKEWLYRSMMTGEDLARFIRSEPELLRLTFFADSSRPEMIETMKRGGIDVRPVKKGRDSVKAGIDRIRTMPIRIDPGSSNLVKEIKMFKFKDGIDGKPTEDPVEIMDHAMDAMRYAVVGDGTTSFTLSAIERIKVPRSHAAGLTY